MPNNLEENVNRVKAAKIAIANAITAKGGTVSSGDGLEDFASDIGTIPSGGGGGSEPFIITVSGFDDWPTVNKTSAEIIDAYNANSTDIIILIEGFQNNDYIIRDIDFDNSSSNMRLYGTISKVDRVDSTYQLTNSTFRLTLSTNNVGVSYKSIRLDCNSSDNSVVVGNYTEFPT